jgi:hypothetical protein
MKVFSGFLNKNIHGDLRMVGKERIKLLGGEETPTEEVEKRCSSNTSPSVIVLMVHPDRASFDPGCTTTLS